MTTITCKPNPPLTPQHWFEAKLRNTVLRSTVQTWSLLYRLSWLWKTAAYSLSCCTTSGASQNLCNSALHHQKGQLPWKCIPLVVMLTFTPVLWSSNRLASERHSTRNPCSTMHVHTCVQNNAPITRMAAAVGSHPYRTTYRLQSLLLTCSSARFCCIGSSTLSPLACIPVSSGACWAA